MEDFFTNVLGTMFGPTEVDDVASKVRALFRRIVVKLSTDASNDVLEDISAFLAGWLLGRVWSVEDLFLGHP
jgi:hypothetical protein